MGIISNKLRLFEKKIQSIFHKMQDELDDHILAINENTEELDSHTKYFAELEEKMEKLSERMDEIHCMILQQSGTLLGETEQRIFLTLSRGSASAADISIKTGISELSVKAHIISMICKGVSVKEKIIGNEPHFSLEKHVAKKNIEIISTGRKAVQELRV